MSDNKLKLYTGDDEQEEKDKGISDEVTMMIDEMMENENVPNKFKEELKKLKEMYSDGEYQNLLKTDEEFHTHSQEIIEELEELYDMMMEDDDDDDGSFEEGEFGAYITLSKEIEDTDEFFNRVIRVLQEEWNIKVGLKSKKNKGRSDKELYVSRNGNTVEIHIEEAIVPNELLEMGKKLNYMNRNWEEEYKATVVVLASEDYKDTLKLSELFVKVVSACAMQENVTGILQNDVMYEKDYYIHNAEMMKKGVLPIANLLWVHILKEDDEKVSAWTSGMEFFGREDMEIVHIEKDPVRLIEIILSIGIYMLSEDVYFEDGETIEASPEESFEVTFEDGEYTVEEVMKLSPCTDSE